MNALMGKGWPNPYQEAAQILREWLAQQGGNVRSQSVEPGPFGGAMPSPTGPAGPSGQGLANLLSALAGQGQAAGTPFMPPGYQGGGTGLSDRLRDLYGPTGGGGLDASLLGPTPATANFGGFNLGETPLLANMGW